MTTFAHMRRFSNHRRWQDFITAIHDSVTQPCSVTYPVVLGALRSGRAWFSDAAVGETELKSCGCAVKREPLGV
jgi:hypothetical protein